MRVWQLRDCPHRPHPSRGGPLSRGAVEGLRVRTWQPLARIAGEGAERSEAGEGGWVLATPIFMAG